MNNRQANRSHHSISSFSQSSLLQFDRLRSTELVVEEEAQHIDSRLDEAEQRLRMLSNSTQSSVRQLKRLFGTVEKKQHLRNKSASNCANGGHLHAIRHHLNQLEQDINVEPETSLHNDWAEGMCEQESPTRHHHHLQSQITAKLGWPSSLLRQSQLNDDC
jgi:hypothetical protein